jgi:sugar lactone lactonase YvrE
MNRFGTAILAILVIFFVCDSHAQWANNQSAVHVIGQATMTGTSAGYTGDGLNGPNDVAIDVAHGKIYVADLNRVTRYSFPDTTDQPVADLIFGQADEFASDPNAGQSGLSSVTGLAVSPAGTLFVVDQDHNRVLRFKTAWQLSSNNPDADAVIGQPDFTTYTSGTTGAKLTTPYTVSVDDLGHLWVSDYGNNRVLRFDNSDSLSDGPTAAQVLGQSDLTSSAFGTSAATMFYPFGVVAKGGKLWVADAGNNRILRFDAVLSKDPAGGTADGVLGSSDFTTSGDGTGGTITGATITPNYLDVDDKGNLYESDSPGGRVLVFLNAAAKVDGASADVALGAADLTTNVQTLVASVSDKNFRHALGVRVESTSGKLFVADYSFKRVLEFSASSPLPITLASFGSTLAADGVELAWKTASETNNYGFFVERSTNAKTGFANISGLIPGHGTSASGFAYSFTDATAPIGTMYYRLKQVDLDGSVHYSEPISLSVTTAVGEQQKVPVEFALHQNYPNPFNPSTNLRFTVAKSGFATLTVHNILGEQVASLYQGIANPGQYYTVAFSGSSLPSGIYFARLTANGHTSTQKMILNK